MHRYAHHTHSQYPMELYMFCNLICMPTPDVCVVDGGGGCTSKELELTGCGYTFYRDACDGFSEREDSNYSMKIVIMSCFLQM